ncbi:hypothetical protein [Pseudomonas putida]|uniref:hypothetical protein n=1 Tax=Pseudomonas putida TaxID=303 RepID=UPI003905C7A9
MPNQNNDQAEQLIAEVLAAACLLTESERGATKDRNVVQGVLQCTYEALRNQKIFVYSQAGAAKEV